MPRGQDNSILDGFDHPSAPPQPLSHQSLAQTKPHNAPNDVVTMGPILDLTSIIQSNVTHILSFRSGIIPIAQISSLSGMETTTASIQVAPTQS